MKVPITIKTASCHLASGARRKLGICGLLPLLMPNLDFHKYGLSGRWGGDVGNPFRGNRPLYFLCELFCRCANRFSTAGCHGLLVRSFDLGGLFGSFELGVVDWVRSRNGSRCGNQFSRRGWVSWFPLWKLLFLGDAGRVR